MARTAAGKALTELHHRQQAELKAQVVRDVLKLYPAWTPSKPDSWAAFEEAMVLLIKKHSRTSAALAARYLELFRAVDAPIATTGTVPLAEVVSEEVMRARIAGAAKGGVYRALKAGQPYEQAMKNGFVAVSGAASKEVGDCGRSTILDEVRRDDQMLGYARVTGGDPCAFCAMLAGRGPVYKDGSDDPGDHEHGNCGYEPVYEGAEWPGRAREFRELWETEGGSLNTFRQALAKQAS